MDLDTETEAPRAIVADFADLNVEAPAALGSEVHLEHPATGAPLYDANDNPIFIAVLGEDAKQVKKVDAAARERNIDRNRKHKQVTVDTLDADAVTRLVAATVRWNLMPVDGVVLECNEKNARRLYNDPRFPWIAEQLDAAMKDRKRFFGKASTP